MIHTIHIKHAGHTHVFRFPTERINEVRVALATRGFRGELPWDLAFEASRRLFNLIGRSEMDELELLAERLQKQGFYSHLSRQDEGWHCMLATSVTSVHRPPTGRGKSAFEAMQAAVEDLAKLRKPAKV